MSRSRNQSARYRGGDIGGGYPSASRWFKKYTNRLERTIAHREMVTVLHTEAWEADVPLWHLFEVCDGWDSATQDWVEFRQLMLVRHDRAVLEQVTYWITMYDCRLGYVHLEYEIVLA